MMTNDKALVHFINFDLLKVANFKLNTAIPLCGADMWLQITDIKGKVTCPKCLIIMEKK